MIAFVVLLVLLAVACKLGAAVCFALDRRNRGERLLPALADEVEKVRQAGLRP